MRTALAAAALTMVSGCAGAGPLLHPARTLPAGDVRAAGGFSANVVTGDLASELRAARVEATNNPNAPGAPGSNPTYAKGALVAAAVGPGLAPFVSARVGVGAGAEGGISYTGRGARIDVRKAWEIGNGGLLSLGIGGTGLFYAHEDGSPLPNVDLGELHGYGADVPLLVGWQSAGGFYMFWAGARGGWEHDEVLQLTSEPKTVTLGVPPIGLSADRFFAGGLVGMAVGFRHIHVALELDAAYQAVSGAYNGTSVSVGGFALSPGAALWWKF